MFERYTQTARRVIFHARHYASRFGNPYIETEYLLLGLLAEDPVLRERLLASHATAESFATEIESRTPSRQSISSSLDLPLSQDSRHALEYAAEESQALHHSTIDCGHLVLGLLRIENCLAATFLRQHGIDYTGYRETVARALATHHVSSAYTSIARDNPVERSEEWETAYEIAASPSLAASIAALKQHVVGAVKHLDTYSDEYGRQRLKRKSWSRKEALGHLINLAAAHHEWVARALTEPRVTVAGYPQEEWVFVQKYQEYSWRSLVDLWLAINQLLVHVLTSVPEERAHVTCRIGIEEPRPLLAIVLRYVEQTEDLVGQILSRL